MKAKVQDWGKGELESLIWMNPSRLNCISQRTNCTEHSKPLPGLLSTRKMLQNAPNSSFLLSWQLDQLIGPSNYYPILVKIVHIQHGRLQGQSLFSGLEDNLVHCHTTKPNQWSEYSMLFRDSMNNCMLHTKCRSWILEVIIEVYVS